MKNHIKYILLICLLAIFQLIKAEEKYQYGLAFKSYEVEKESRTSLNLTPEKLFSFPKGFILEFDASFEQVLYNFGYIFRIISEEGKHVDLLLNRTTNKDKLEPQLTAIYKSGQVLYNKTFEELNVNFDDWINIQITINSKQDRLELLINGQTAELIDDYFSDFKKVNIIFGKNDLLSFETSDVPTMALKDIFIKNIEKETLAHWKLSTHTEAGVFDEVKQWFAKSKSPQWLLDNHAYWKKLTSFTTGDYPQMAFDRARGVIGVTDSLKFYSYDIDNNTLQVDKVEGLPLKNKVNQMEYSTKEGKFFTYDFIGEAVLYNSQAQQWNNYHPNLEEPHYWHHNRMFSATDNALYTWFEYGFHIYKNKIFKYSFDSSTWEEIAIKGDVIAPRYLAGLGKLDDKNVLVFGGYGSEKGDQKLYPHNYYDLYSFNLETHEAKKIWELDEKEHNFVVVNSLVVDSVNRCFYALCFPHQKFRSSLKLYRFSIDYPSYEVLADSIPYAFSDIFSHADLYLNNKGDQLIAITSNTDTRKTKADVEIYSLSFPPLNSSDLYQTESEFTIAKFLYVIVASLILLALLGLFFVYRWRGRSKKDQTIDLRNKAEQLLDEEYDPIIGIKPFNIVKQKQSIVLFGGFQVMDEHSEDITGEFTPMLKQLFLLILLYTLKDGKGISSVKLREILWFDKTEESAKNNRGVSLSKLRSIFEKIGDISINSKNSYWTLQFDEAIYCDYYETQILIDRLYQNIDLRDLERLLSIVSVGEMLPNLQVEWVDGFKSDFSNKLIDLLLHIVDKSPEYALDQTMLINIADAIFVHDSLNEDALRIKCRILVQMGKNGLAQRTYHSFTKEYQAIFDADFEYSLDQIIS